VIAGSGALVDVPLMRHLTSDVDVIGFTQLVSAGRPRIGS
jgi:hypothetical protein